MVIGGLTFELMVEQVLFKPNIIGFLSLQVYSLCHMRSILFHRPTHLFLLIFPLGLHLQGTFLLEFGGLPLELPRLGVESRIPV